MKSIHSTLLGLCVLGVSALSHANVILDFESPLPDGLVSTSFGQGNHVSTNSVVTNQYLSYGLMVSGAALVASGVGHAASGANALAGIDHDGNVDYDTPVSFSFFQPGNGGQTGTTDYFAYRTDRGGGSGNVITISAFDFDNVLIGQVFYTENDTFLTPLSISGVGQFHTVTVDQTLYNTYNTYNGGIALDLVEFGDIRAVPEPKTLALVFGGLGLMSGIAWNRKRESAVPPVATTAITHPA